MCWSKQIFGGAKDFLPNFPNLPKKLSCNCCRPFLWCELQKNGLHLFSCKSLAPFLPRFSVILPKFSQILPKFSGILPGFSTNQNFWGCACTFCIPTSYTTGLKQGFSTCGPRKNFWWATALYYCNWVRFARWPSKTGALVAMKTKTKSRFNVEDDFICALACIESRISLLSNSKQAQPSHWL